MVQDEVHVDLDVPGVGRVDQVLEVRLGAIQGVDRVVIIHVIGVIGRGRMRRGQPEGGRAHPVQVVQLVLDALEVADAIAVAVGEGVNQELVGRRGTLGPVEGVGIRDQRSLDRLGIPFLLHGESLGQRLALVLESDGSRAGLPGIGGGFHGHGHVSAPGGGSHGDPGVGRGGGPVPGARNAHDERLGGRSTERMRSREEGQGRLRIFLRGLLGFVAGHDGGQQDPGCEQKALEHRAIF